MNDFYFMEYAGSTGAGGGVMYIGNGKIVGMDVGGIRYAGTYVEQNDRIVAKAAMTSTEHGGQLVTGDLLPPGVSLDLQADWPIDDFEARKPLSVSVQGRQVRVRFTPTNMGATK